jgi:two-component system, chemotaxis family, chemotaxis protein CheY
MYYRAALQKAGFHVDEALNGLEAIERLLEQPFDLLIVDINMPQMDGLTFLQTLRAKEPPVSTIPALVISTEAEPQRVAAAMAAGANLYLVKPLSEPALVQYVSLLCGSPNG